MANKKVLTDVLAPLTPKLQQACGLYLDALKGAKRANADARAAIAAKRSAWSRLYDLSKQIETGEKKWKPGTILFNIRNGRFYEVAKQEKGQEREWTTFTHLHAKTGRCASGCTYGYGPKIPLPASHPFVTKRANARLAERLEGKDV